MEKLQHDFLSYPAAAAAALQLHRGGEGKKVFLQFHLVASLPLSPGLSPLQIPNQKGRKKKKNKQGRGKGRRRPRVRENFARPVAEKEAAATGKREVERGRDICSWGARANSNAAGSAPHGKEGKKIIVSRILTYFPCVVGLSIIVSRIARPGNTGRADKDEKDITFHKRGISSSPLFTFVKCRNCAARKEAEK